MDAATAREVLQLVNDATMSLHRAAHLVRARADDEDFAAFRLGVGHVLATVGEWLTMPIYVSHPDLTPEVLRDIVEQKRKRRKAPRNSVSPSPSVGGSATHEREKKSAPSKKRNQRSRK
jgi:hypothetical protein